MAYLISMPLNETTARVSLLRLLLLLLLRLDLLKLLYHCRMISAYTNVTHARTYVVYINATCTAMTYMHVVLYK
jgi:hypothetical protein